MQLVSLLATATVLARLAGGEVTLDDATREVSFRSRDEAQFRALKGLDGERGRLDVLRRCALRRTIGQPGDDPALEARAEAFRRDDFLGRWAARSYDLPVDVPAAEAVRAELERTLPDLPERWRLWHIFLAAPTESARAAARLRLELLRPGLTTLVEFERRARELSESESAARGGRLGIVKQGFLRPEVEAVLRTLPVAQVSPPVVTGPGVHLFWVEERMPAGKGLDAARVEREVARRRAAAVAANRAQVLARAPAARLAGATERENENDRLWQVALAEGRLLEEDRRRGDDVAADLRMRSRLESEAENRIVEPTESEIAEHHAGHPERFRQPEQLAVRTLRLPIPRDRDPFAEELRLEAEVAAVRAAGGGLEALGRERGLPLTTLALQPLIEVAGALGPPVFEQVKGLTAGEISAPIHDAEVWVIVEVTAREPARPLAAAEAAPQVRAAIRAERRRAALARRTSELLAGLELTDEGRQWVAEGAE